MLLWCVRDGWRQGQTAILTQLLLLIIALSVIFKNPLNTSSTSWQRLLNRGGVRWGLQPSVCKLVLTLAFLSPTNSTAPGICLYSFIMPTCFCFHLFTQVHLWLTARSRVNIQQHYQMQFSLISKTPLWGGGLWTFMPKSYKFSFNKNWNEKFVEIKKK